MVKKSDFINADEVKAGVLTPDAVYWGDELVWSSTGPPTITTNALPAMYRNTAFSRQISAVGTQPITQAVTAGSLPAGLTLSSAGLLSGTPTAEGAFSFTVTATNAEGFDTQAFSGTVLAQLVAPSITTTSLAGSLNVGSVFSQTITATGNPTPSFSVTAGALPAGFTLSSAGVLSGTPTTEGAFAFTVRATNSSGFDTQAFSGTVGPELTYPPALDEAVLWLDADYSVAGEPRAINQGTGGSVLNAKYGSVLGAYVYDGALNQGETTIGANNASTPSTASLQISGDVSFFWDCTLQNWTVCGNSVVIGKRSGSSGEYCVRHTGSNAGRITLFYYEGATIRLFSSDPPTTPGLVNGARYQFAATITANEGGNAVCRFYYREPTATTWEDFGTSTLTGTPRNATATAVAVCVGSESIGFGPGIAGTVIHRAMIQGGVTTDFDAPVLDVDMANVADYATSFTATTGQTVTVNSTTVDTNDPLFLPHDGENYVHFPGATGNCLSTPTAAAYDMADNLDLSARIVVSNEAGTFIAREDPFAERSWWFAWSGTPYSLRASFTAPGGASYAPISSIGLTDAGYVPGDVVWVRVTFESGVVKFWHAPDQAGAPSSWTQLGSTMDGSATLTTLYQGSSAINIGAFRGGGIGPLRGSLHRTIVRNGIGGTVVFDFNAAADITSAGATSFTATSGQTVTVKRSTAGRKTALVTRPIWLFGTDDYLEVADNALFDFDGDVAFLAIFRDWATRVTNTTVFGQSGLNIGDASGWRVSTNGATAFRIDVRDTLGAGAIPSLPDTPGGAMKAIGAVLERAVNEYRTYRNTTLNSTADSSTWVTIETTSTLPVRVGARSNSATGMDMECIAVAVWRRALTTDEIAAINTYYGTA